MSVLTVKSIYIGHVRSTGIYIDIMLIPALAVAYFTVGMEFTLLVLPVFAIHELAHIFAAYLFDCKISSFTLMPIGGTIQADSNINSTKVYQMCAIYAFAPMTNLTLFALFYALGIKDSSLIFMQIAYANGILALFSLLTVYPLDGGSILKTLLSVKLDERKTLSVLLTVNIVVSMLLICAVIYCFICFAQILWQFIVIAFLFVYSTFKEKSNSVSSSISNIINKDTYLGAQSVIRSNKLYVLKNATIGCAIKSGQHNAFNTYAVIDDKFNIYGELTEKQLLEAAIIYGINAPVSKALKLN